MAFSMNTGAGGRRRGRGGRQPMAEINVTPFVDVMLVLLIIFMVTAPLLVAGVPIDLPESRAKPVEQEREPVQISIDGDGFVYMDDNQIPFEELPTALSQLCTVQAETGTAQPQQQAPQIMLRGDRILEYGQVMLVLGELNRASCNRVSLVTTSSSDGS